MLGQQKLSPLGLEMFFKAVQKYPFELVKQAFLHHIHTSPYMPKPYDIISYIEGSDTDKAAEAWLAVKAAIRKHGSYRSVAFDDPAVHYAIDAMGGWPRICMMSVQEEPFRRQEFEALYQRARGISWEHVPKRLAGIHELNNRAAIANGKLEEMPDSIETGKNAVLVRIKTLKSVLMLGGGEYADLEKISG